ncbi:alpha/beta fold hydrolase [Lacisediminihabitans sp.]|uniref:alpha/beta fold hydrolase n=1 Tax=Lacisediminihabitans sp. TaxID=2787631 RepID=UPI00374CDED7
MTIPTDTTRPVFETHLVSVDGLQIRYTTSPHPGTETVVLLSPWPESIYAWWPMWPTLAAEFSLVAIDLPGFGGSEGRADLMSPRAMGLFVPRILAALGLERPHVVGPDVGSSALLFTAALHPDSVSSIQIGGGAASFPLQTMGLLQKFIDAGSIEPFRGLDAAEVVGGAVKSIPGYTAPDFVVQDYIDSYAGSRFAESIAYVQRYPADLDELADLLPTIQTPVGILAARNDPFLKLDDPEYLNAVLPHSTLTVLDNTHNAWEESPEVYAGAIIAWVHVGHKR